MADEKNFKQSLISAFEQLKSQHATMTALVCDVAALRTALLENAPVTLVRYEQLLAEEITNATPTMASAAQVYDDLILALKGDVRWVN
jgi:hypothetical protein